MQPVIIKSVLEALTRHPQVRLAIVFGSVTAGVERPDSDIDVAVLGPSALDAHSKMALIADLAEVTGRPADVIDLHQVGEPLLGQILKHGRQVLGDDADYAALVRRHLFDTADFMPYVDRMLAERRRAWIG